jgi:hypothetical protein
LYFQLMEQEMPECLMYRHSLNMSARFACFIDAALFFW